MNEKEKYIELILINSTKYTLKRLLGYFIGFLGIILIGITGDRGNGSVLSRVVEISLQLYFMILIFSFFLIIIAFVLICNKENNKGEIYLSALKLIIKRQKLTCVEKEEYDFQNQPVSIYLNNMEYRGIYKRTIKTNGGNNWIEIATDDGLKKKFEFLLNSQKQEDELKELIRFFQKEGLNIIIKKSSSILIDKWNNF